MNGSELLLDTNAFIYFFEGRERITTLVVETPTIDAEFGRVNNLKLISDIL